MMENMDISCGALDPGNDSAMDVDEAMDVCSDYEKAPIKDFTFNVNNTVLDASNSQSSTSNNATSEMGDSVNTTVVLNGSFPNQQENAHDSVDKITRFPLGIAKECNQTLNSLHSCKERIKSTLNNTVSHDLRLEEKENMYRNSLDADSFEFPTETKHQIDQFPLDHKEAASVSALIAAPSFEAEEQFTPASDYIFSAADFDCLLSRGTSQTETVAATASTASASQPTSTDLPRNSVLINFDPLLRRQTIITQTDGNNDTIGSLETTSACLALVDFAQQQQQQQLHHEQLQQEHTVNSVPLIPLLEKDEFETQGSLPDDGDTTLAPQDTNANLWNQTVTTSESVSSEIVIAPELGQQTSEANEQENINFGSLVVSGSESVDLGNLIPNRLQEESGGSAEHLSISDGPVEQDFSNSIEAERQNTEELFSGTNNSSVDNLQIVTPRKQADSDLVVCESIISPISAEHHLGKETIDSAGGAASFVSNLAPDAKSEKDIESIVEFDITPVESNALTSPSNMLAEPLQEKQNSTIHNMSDDRMTQLEDENVDTAKKSKSEDINIADMEKKMHDVELREENMLKRITEKDKTISKMSNVVEAYERTIAELISEKEMLIRNHELECESLKQDNEINAQHLESLEKTFSNLYMKYDRMKKNAVKYKEHEEKLLEKIMKLEECLRAQEQRYEKMKSHAMSQLEIANTKIDEAIRNHSQESAKLKAQIKKEELYRISINEQLIQKSKENEALVKICDELISETN